jgi:hypothetical protein
MNYAGHSALDFEEFAFGLKQAFSDCKVVEVLEQFTNFTRAVQPFLNTASTTDGADHFSDFRYFS